MSEHDDDRSFHVFMKRNQPETPPPPPQEMELLLRRVEADRRPGRVLASRILKGWAMVAAMLLVAIGILNLNDRRNAGRMPPLESESTELNTFIVASADEAVYGDAAEDEFVLSAAE